MEKRFNYKKYLLGPVWRAKRQERLRIDGFRCRLCDSRTRLQVHHRPTSYKKMPNESVITDLVTTCEECHKLITNKIRKDQQRDGYVPKKRKRVKV